MTLWEVDIHPAAGQADQLGQEIASEAADLGLGQDLQIRAAHGYLLQGELDDAQVRQLTRDLLADDVVQRAVIAQVGDERLHQPPAARARLVHVMPKPGVTDAVAESVAKAIADFGTEDVVVRTLRKYWVDDLPDEQLERLCAKLLANDSIEQVIVGPLRIQQLQPGSAYQFQLRQAPLLEADPDRLLQISRERQLSLTQVEMQTIQQYFLREQREPTDVELETIAQTWSEHCSHKTLAGKIAYRDENGERKFDNMLKETIFSATQTIREQLGDEDWCVSVFKDNAGIVRFDEQYHVAFKVETHNRPSALEPYGGANTGIGGVIRDTLGTGLGAKPVCNTDVFCFAPPDLEPDELPPGVLHPRRLMKGVVSGVRDYGNRMGIPTVNGAVYFDKRYVGNPLVFCGNAGILPVDRAEKQPQAGDLIVSIGGRTGRDGIHGATFSSVELTSDSESLSGGAVQIGNAITEKMVLDVLIQARDRGLYSAVTDCGAGGFSSAVGEMGEEIGAEVWLDRAPLKYQGLSYTEIWISEAQERMVFAVPQRHWSEFQQLCDSEDVEASVIGRFEPTGRLKLTYDGRQVADLEMQFLHAGRPPVVREAVYRAPQTTRFQSGSAGGDTTQTLLDILASPNVASKHWIIRQYDHEVQGGSVIKPLVGAENDGPSDAAVVRPRLDSQRGLVLACGMNPYYGDYDTYHMAAAAIDEAVRNCVAVGADPARVAILDNFCWGYTDRSETLGSLVRAALACHDVAVAWKTPFISGKDSLNNEYSYVDGEGRRQTISIPASLLISAMGQVQDVATCVTMDLKEAGNFLYQLGATHDELGGSHLGLVTAGQGGQVPRVDLRQAHTTFCRLHRAIQQGLVRSCHDLGEGGLAVAAAEMAIGGRLGLSIALPSVPQSRRQSTEVLLFSESCSRLLCEVAPDRAAQFEATLGDVPHARIGHVTAAPNLVVHDQREQQAYEALNVDVARLKQAWQSTLDWD